MSLLRLTKAQSRIVAAAIIVVFFIVAISLVPSSKKGTIPTALKAIPSPSLAPIFGLPTPKSTLESTPAPSTTLPSPAPSDNLTPPSAAFSLKDFHRSETRNGKVVWEVHARTGEYAPQNNFAKLDEPIVHFYREDGSKIELVAKSAVLQLKGSELIEAVVRDQVKITYNDAVVITTDEATYKKDSEEIVAPGLVTITGQNFVTSGKKLRAFITNKEVRLEEDVHTTLYGVLKKRKK